VYYVVIGYISSCFGLLFLENSGMRTAYIPTYFRGLKVSSVYEDFPTSETSTLGHIGIIHKHYAVHGLSMGRHGLFARSAM
jgi:hypothetical protein